ncbi:MAG: hypothetical protein SGJ10_08120 [Bacteroidota bacterium]|nr:hypothetical protein [Bacteroidota bacterium]
MSRKRKIVLYTFVGITIILLVGLYFSPYRHLVPGMQPASISQAEYINAKKQAKSLYDTSKKNIAICKYITEKIFPFWYSTLYDFNGTTEQPRKGKIACGYFVATILRDAGFDIKREKMAQMPSEKMIRELLLDKYITRYSNIDIEDFVKKLGPPQNKLYIVGLDTHIAFLMGEENTWYMVHSSGRWPFCVIKEKALESKTLKKSNYKVVGRLSDQ